MEKEKSTDLSQYVTKAFLNKTQYTKEELRPLVEKLLKGRVSFRSNLEYLTEVTLSVYTDLYHDPDYQRSPKAQQKLIDEAIEELYDKRLEQIKRDKKIYEYRKKLKK